MIAPLRASASPGPRGEDDRQGPLRRGEVDQDFDQEELAALLDQEPFNVAVADLYQSRFRRVPGVVYTAGVRHANNVAKAFQKAGINARAVSGETPKRELTEILAAFERGEVDVLCNAMLLAEGWNSPRATICMHPRRPLAARLPAARRARHPPQPGQGSGTGDRLRPPGDHPRRDGDLPAQPARPRRLPRRRDRRRPVRRGRRVRVERRVVPVSADPERRLAVLERELWRIAVENLNYSEQHAWALAGARVTAGNWRRAKAMIQHDQAKELRRRFLLTCLQRNRNHQLRLKALSEVAALREAEAFDDAVEVVATWPRDERAAGAATRARDARRAGIGARPGAGMGLAPRGDQPRAARGVRRAALARDQAPARPLRQLLRARARPQCAPHRPRRPPAGPPAGRRVARRRSRATRRRPRRSSAGRGCGWRESPRPWPGSCCATSRGAAGAAAAALLEPVERRRWQRRGARAREARGGGGRGADADEETEGDDAEPAVDAEADGKPQDGESAAKAEADEAEAESAHRLIARIPSAS